MSNLTRLFLLLGVVAALLFGLAASKHASREHPSRLDTLPINGSGYAGRELSLTPAEQSVFANARVVKRLYHFGRFPFVLMAIDGSRYRHAVHDPTYCFRGMGWEVAHRNPIPIEGGEALLLTLTRDGEKRRVLYWFTNGASRHSSVIRYWLQTTIRRLTFGHSGPEPLFVVLQPAGDSAPPWHRVIHHFGPIHDL
ncbi:exosortase-associated EpsI family protein [Desulfoluna spongiiphila]|uniref:Methanolan biosynthesis EpsI domain-containing protein n=1 Tax=Desulfoluna spongiiphila TaxID=419481 RepID=A0A1G5ET10_9BACT|nr:exosortase-associated EpsI family protein [Desulfoluna spongiiphila]SCY30113.1 Protein of unknown function [Desulfoluna spongiiphila]VVS91317.1 methanolan biosynthesis epsi [Desulfoluna spongiiphila]